MIISKLLLLSSLLFLQLPLLTAKKKNNNNNYNYISLTSIAETEVNGMERNKVEAES